MTTATFAILSSYRTARKTQTAESAAYLAWAEARRQYKHLRAPDGLEAFDDNTGARKSYRIPLAEALYGRGAYSELGSHSAKWPRTVRSYRACGAAVAEFLAALDILTGIKA